MNRYKIHTKFQISSKAVLLEEKVEETTRRLEQEGYIVTDVSSNISYAGNKDYMILCQITYLEEVDLDDESHILDSYLDLDI